MRSIITFVAVTAAYLAPFCSLPCTAQAASDSEELKRAAAHIVSAEQDLTTLKGSALDTFKSLEHQRIDADQQSDKWEGLAKLEGNESMKSVIYGFRDAFRSHSRELTEVETPLRDLGRTGERLESDVQLLHVLQADLEKVVRRGVPDRNVRSLLTDTKDGLALLQQDMSFAAKEIEIAEKLVAGQISSTLKYDKQLRQLRAFAGDSQDRIKKWEKELVETELANNIGTARALAKVKEHASSFTDLLTTIENATKTLQLVAGRQ